MKRNKHSLSHYKLLSSDMGQLVPIGWFEVLPGDTIQHATSALVRAAPLLSAVMHPLQVRIHHWYVPYRLLWNEFEDFITGGPAGVSAPAFPTVTLAGAATIGSLADHLGIPTGIASLQFSALPIRAYYRIWNENYRDEDLEAALGAGLAVGSGDSAFGGTNLPQTVAWEKDYFTSSRPWEQKGPAVTVPLGSTAPVSTIAGVSVLAPQLPVRFRNATSGAIPSGNMLATVPADGAPQPTSTASGALSGQPLYIENLAANLAGASAVTVNVLRQALALQRFEEARARYGSRYTEYLRYLGVRSSDARLQRPEYLGGGKQTVQFSEVLQTGPSAAPDQANTVGALKGHGIAALRSNRYRRFIEEHGLIMTVMSVRPKSIYMNGMARQLNRRIREDFWQKEFEHIGQQPVKNKEVYAAHASPEATFGYQDRYDEYRRLESYVSGEFRTTLNYWHMARDFGSAPALNASFVACVPTMRTFASSATDPLYVMANHSIQARRMVARTGKSYIF